MLTKLSLAAIVAAAVTLSAPVLATQSNADATVTATIENANGWCSGPRQHTDFRCFKN
jgi:Spy/CpxP family protein refolding chaperone